MKKRFIEIIKRIIWPDTRMVGYTVAVMILLIAASLIFFGGGSFLMYTASVLSLYLLILAIANGPKLVNILRYAILTTFSPDQIRAKIESNKYGKVLLERDDAREILLALPGIIGGLAYAIFNLTVGIMQSSIWLGCVGIYALCLNTAKIYIVHGMRQVVTHDDMKHIGAWERQRCKLAGIWLAVLDLIMACMVYMMLKSNQNYDLSGFVLYIYFFYAVYSVTFSIANIYIFRFSKSPVRFALKAMNLARALMSLLVLQTTLVGNADFIIEFVKQFMNAFTGITIIITTFIMAGVLIWKGSPPRELLPGEKPGTSWYRRPSPPVKSSGKKPHMRHDKPSKKLKAGKPHARKPQHERKAPKKTARIGIKKRR